MGQSLFPLLRPAYESTPELSVLAAEVRAGTASDDFRRQTAFDDAVTQELSSLKLADSQIGQFENLLFHSNPVTKTSPGESSAPLSEVPPKKSQTEEEEDDDEPTKRARPRTILLAVSVGLVATVCMVIFLISDRMNSFEGADRIGELLASANTLTGDEFEAVETKAGDLQDWFFLKHGLEHYAVPKQFADIKTVGCRVFKFDGATVAQIMAVQDKELLLYMFRSNDLGIKTRKGKWEIVEDDKWVGGLTGMKDTCFLVAFKGDKDEMKEFLARGTK